MKYNFETELRQALEQYNRAVIKNLPEAEKPVNYSPRHQQRMEELLAHCDRAHRPAVRTKIHRTLALAAALILMAALAISGSATLKNIDIDDYSHHGAYHNEKAEAYLTTVDLFKNKVDLLYVDSKTNSFSNDVQDYYVDDARNEYIYNSNGTLRSFKPSEKTATLIREKVFAPTFGKDTILNERQAKEYGTELLRKMRGDDFEKFEFAFCKFENGEMYYVAYRQTYDDYFGQSCIAMFDQTGILHLITYKANGDLTNFDPAILDKISDKTLRTFVAEKLKTDYPDYSYIRHEILQKYIRKVDGKLGILLNVEGNFTRNMDGKSVTELTEIFYPFPDQAAAVKK